jgi:CRISPR-associated protein Cas2
MTVLLIERVSASLRGELTRWLVEIKAGVFLGDLTAVVRERLWMDTCGKMKGGAVTMFVTTPGEPGYLIRFWGDPSRTVVDFDGIPLIRVRRAEDPAAPSADVPV